MARRRRYARRGTRGVAAKLAALGGKGGNGMDKWFPAVLIGLLLVGAAFALM